MTNSKAIEIIQDLVLFNFYSQGVTKEIDDAVISRIKEYSLSEMLQADKIVERINSKSSNKKQMTIADRLIAATYVLFNYQPEPASDCNSIVAFNGNGVYVAY